MVIEKPEAEIRKVVSIGAKMPLILVKTLVRSHPGRA